MHLGTLIRRLENEDDAGTALDAIGDLVLFSEVTAMGEHYGESPAAYTATAVARFASGAGDEDWVTLMGAMDRSGDPQCTFLTHALRWSLSHDARDLAHPGEDQPCQCSATSQAGGRGS
ncbi:MAG: hypothetical protein ACK5JT_11495 [Hyphomicrobiaceae bacterium]